MSHMVGVSRRTQETPSKMSNFCPPNSSPVPASGNKCTPAPSRVREDEDLLGGYHIHNHKLGEGGFGKVRLATHLKTREKVAIKCMEKKKLGDDLFRVKTEITVLMKLNHKNIAKLLQVIETKDSIYLIMELCSGGELFDYLVSKSRLIESEAASIMRDLVNALSYIHAMGFAHRDLKPENILFNADHEIKLIDFGLAANGNDLDSTLSKLSTCCGSPAYAAPELLSGLPYSGPSVDVWSAGVLLYALLVGQLPFEDDNISTLYRKIQSGIFVLPSRLSFDAKHLITSMLQTNPKKRLTIEQILTHPWINKGNASGVAPPKNISVQKHFLDEEVFWDCHLLFPSVPIFELRQNIMYKFGYHHAAYQLLKDKPKELKPKPINKRLSKSEDSGINENSLCRKDSFEVKSLELLKEKENTDKPKLLGAKRKIDYSTQASSGASPEKQPRPMPPVMETTSNETSIPTPVKERIKQFQVGQQQILSPQLKVCFGAHYKNRNMNDTANPSPNSKIPVSARRFIDPAANTTPNKQQDKVLSPFKTPQSTTVTPAKKPKTNPQQVKSPLQECKNKVANIMNGKQMATPLKQGNDLSTPKKSLFKSLLESVTPARAHQPRAITTKTVSKNITLTNFDCPQKCMDKFVQVLTAKGIECKRKEFSLRCSYVGKDYVTLSFSLDICSFEGRIAVQRKRLKGDSWHYKEVCEDILRISNEACA